jgi:hypothetical protein
MGWFTAEERRARTSDSVRCDFPETKVVEPAIAVPLDKIKQSVIESINPRFI